jgi:two-component sensor histidine kinase
MRALAEVQARIYETETLDRVDFAAVLSGTAEDLARIHGENRIRLVRDFDGPLDLDVARAMPLGLLSYEVLLNALKHAWPDDRPGTLRVELRREDGRPTIRVRDDGVGFSADEVVRGLGTGLSRALAAEAGAEVETVSRPGDGTTVTLRLN